MADNDTWIDRVMAYVAPERYARRLMAREYLATYKGSVATRTGTRFDRSSSYRLGRTMDRHAIASMRDRARQTYRDNPIGRSLLNTEIDNVIAEGMTFQAHTSSEEFNSEVEDRFAAWMDVADIRGILSGGDLQRTIYRASRRDGDVGVVLVSLPGGMSRLQVIPGDLICNPQNGPDTASRVDGVDVDDSARPVSFNILDQDEFGRRTWSQVPADDFVFLSHSSDELMVRGETCYSTIFGLLDQIDGYVDAVIIAARMAAVFGLIFKEDTASSQFKGLPTLANSQGAQQRAVTLENGSVKYIGASSDVVQVQAQQPMQQTPDFIRAIFRLLGLPFDMPLELALKDVSQANLSSLRGAKTDYYRACRTRQTWFKKRFLSRIYRWWVSREVKMGRFVSKPPPDFWTHQFMPRGWQFTDPVGDAQAALLEIDMGINSPQGVAAALGRDYETTQNQIEAARKMRGDKSIPEIRSTLTRDPMTQTPTPPVIPPANGDDNNG